MQGYNYNRSFAIMAATALVMFLVSTPVLCLLEVISELEDLCWTDLDFFFKGREVALLMAISSLRRVG